MPVIGTAGHVDHGKSSLIEALTGTHPDRLPEERARGMTIDLGFAHFPGREGEPIGVIDVPGHERFLRNMVAGAWGLDAALLTVAADDGWMPQSADHTRVLAALGVGRLALAVTKSDLASPERAEEVRRQALAECARLGFAQVPSLVVSARTGRNIAELRELLVSLVEGGTPELDWGPEGCLLYVDRAFHVKGVGVVVTGTLKAGPVERGQELRLLPAGRTVRVRGLQSYFREQERVLPGSRVALNLHGVELGQVRRGDCLVGSPAGAWVERELVVHLTPPAGLPASELSRPHRAGGGAGHGALPGWLPPAGGGGPGAAALRRAAGRLLEPALRVPAFGRQRNSGRGPAVPGPGARTGGCGGAWRRRCGTCRPPGGPPTTACCAWPSPAASAGASWPPAAAARRACGLAGRHPGPRRVAVPRRRAGRAGAGDRSPGLPCRRGAARGAGLPARAGGRGAGRGHRRRWSAAAGWPCGGAWPSCRPTPRPTSRRSPAACWATCAGPGRRAWSRSA